MLIKPYFALLKPRLSLSVSGTAIFAYLISCKWNGGIALNFEWLTAIGLFIGGTLLTFGSNGLNQIIEVKQDAAMSRTSSRPLPDGKISEIHARILSWILVGVGLVCLGVFTSFASMYAGLLSFIIYVFIYTPLKGVTPFAVFVGAIPGALPPLIGYMAYTTKLDYPSILLFLIQFFWQFTHFWAIAWLLHEDYQKVNYWLLPTKSGKTKASGIQILLYTIILIISSMMPLVFLFNNGLHNFILTQLIVVLLLGLMLLFFAYKLFLSLENNDAKKLMFASLIYTPLIYLSYILL